MEFIINPEDLTKKVLSSYFKKKRLEISEFIKHIKFTGEMSNYILNYDYYNEDRFISCDVRFTHWSRSKLTIKPIIFRLDLNQKAHNINTKTYSKIIENCAYDIGIYLYLNVIT